jgi:TusA-related sulfurtransferase
MPIVELSKAMRKLEPGQSIEVEATDPAFEADVRAWVDHVGHELVDTSGEGEIKRAVIRKRG